MSLTHAVVVRDCYHGPGKFLLLVLALHLNNKGLCYPSHETLAKELGTGTRQIRRLMDQLIANGVVEITSRNAPKRNTRYRLNLATLTAVKNVHCSTSDSGRTGPQQRTFLTPTADVDVRYKEQRKNNETTTRAPARSSSVLERGSQQQNPDSDALPPAVQAALQRAPEQHRQAIADELREKLAAGNVKNPVAYAYTLVKKARTGEFQPTSNTADPRQVEIDAIMLSRSKAAAAAGAHERNGNERLADEMWGEVRRYDARLRELGVMS